MDEVTLSRKSLLLCYHSLCKCFTATSHPDLLRSQKNWYPSNRSRYPYFVCSVSQCKCVCMCVFMHMVCVLFCTTSMCVCIHECVSFSIETCCLHAKRRLAHACNGSGFIGIWERKLFTYCPPLSPTAMIMLSDEA